MRLSQVLLTSLFLSPATMIAFCQETVAFDESPSRSSSKICCETFYPQRVELKHIEGKGIGYQEGYTTLEGFFTVPSTLQNDWAPFLDIRAHVFNDGKPAVSAGIGLRYLDSRVWGANLYYDYRKTSHFHYNQIGAGLETLGEVWDFRINGYFPVGKKESPAYHFRFDKFKGHSIILQSKKEFAMTGFNAEAAAHAYHSKNLDVYAAAGPYYFNGEGRSAWGGEGRLALTIVDCVRLQLSGSYDTVFKGIGQGEIGLFYSWGGKKTVKKRPCSDCADSSRIIDRALQRVDRQEIIVVDRKHQKSKAIDPVTGNPYTVWFVNNLSHSQGTFESPFNTLANAENASGPNDIIYIFPGDGTDTGMNTGITLQNGQQLLGAGINQTISIKQGEVTIPAQASGLPMVSNAMDPTNLGVQLIAGNNVVSGLNMQDTKGVFTTYISGALSIMGGSHYLIKNNTLSTFGDGDCLNIYVGGDQTVIKNNVFLGQDAGTTNAEGIFIGQFQSIPTNLGTIGGTIIIRDNLFTGANQTFSLNIGIDVPPTVNLSVPTNLPELTIVAINNTINLASNPGTNFPEGILVVNDKGGPSQFTGIFTNNQIFLPNNMSCIGFDIEELTGAVGPLIVTLENNVVQPSPPGLGYYLDDQTGNLQINFGNNQGTIQVP